MKSSQTINAEAHHNHILVRLRGNVVFASLKLAAPSGAEGYPEGPLRTF